MAERDRIDKKVDGRMKVRSYKAYALARYFFYLNFIIIFPWAFLIYALFAKRGYPALAADVISFLPVVTVALVAIWLAFSRCPNCKKKFSKGSSILFNNKVCGSCNVTRNSLFG